MLSIFLLHIIISAICLAAGFLFYEMIGRLSGNNHPRSVIIYLITGLAAVSVFYQIYILFLPANFYALIILLLITGVGIVRTKKKAVLYSQRLYGMLKKMPPLLFILVGSAWCMILLISSGPTIMDDTESYHIQLIKWTQEYGTVPGLANLHERFGFNSAWLTLVSVFTPAHTTHNYYSTLNGMLSVWLSAYLFTALWNGFEQKDMADKLNPAGILLIVFFALVCWPLIRGNAANANYDFITTCITLIIFLELWKNRMDNAASSNFYTELLLWPFFLFTVRIINYPLLLMSLFAFVQLARQRKILLLTGLGSICFVLVLVFIIRNLVLSGYLFYPIYQIDLFSFDWKADREATRQLVSFIRYYNRVNVGLLPLEETRKYTGISWIPLWFRYLLNYDKLVVVTALAGLFLQSFYLRQIRSMNAAVKFLIPVLVLLTVSWLFTAPDPRFAYGQLLAAAYLLAEAGHLRIPAPAPKTRLLVFSILTLIVLTYSSVKIINDSRYSNLIAPAILPLPPAHITRLNNIEFRIPEKILENWNARCYGTALPCLYEIKPGLYPRTHNLKDGFKIKKQTP